MEAMMIEEKNENSCTSNGDLRRKQSNHKTDESVKIRQSVEFFFYYYFFSYYLFIFIGDTPLSKKNCIAKKKFFDQIFFF